MLTQIQKNEILQLIDDEKERLGSYRAVALKCKISEATISQLRKGNYAAAGDDIYATIGVALGYAFDSGAWNVVDTTNFRIVTDVLTKCKAHRMFRGIAHKAGSGKTAAADAFTQANRRLGAFKINCREWGARAFLIAVIHEIGAEMPKGYANINAMIQSIAEAFKRMAHVKPLLILDQANSLKPAALRTLIHIENECKAVLGLTALGTENLEYEIKRGVRLNRMGYDEIDSRFHRDYFHLMGANLADVRKICDANGVTDRAVQDKIFHACKPVRVNVTNAERNQSVLVVEDMRHIEGLVLNYLITSKYQ